MPVDLSDRIIQPPPKPVVTLHPLRRLSQIALGAVLVALPFVNGIRIDITSGQFWLLGQRFTAQNMILLFYGCAIGAILLLGISMVYGRWWCGWICPQTLASDFGDSLHIRFDRLFKASTSKIRRSTSRVVWSVTMAAAAAATAAIVCCYFYPAHRVWSSLIDPFSDTRVAGHLSIIALIIGADLLWVRRHFCRRGCPYGLMLSLIGDKRTMTVRYLEERDADCIQCGKCVTICPMAIDIRKGPNQMECIGCGECIDACNDILPRIKTNPKEGLIELSYGPSAGGSPSKQTSLHRIGMWDVRRVFILGTSIVLLCGFLFEMFGSHPSWAAIVPNGEITHSGPFIFERYELTIQNGKPHDATFSLSTSGIDHLAMVAPKRIISVSRNSRRTFRLTLEAPINQLSGGQRYPVNIFVQSLDGSTERHSASTIFYVPELSAPLKAG